MSVVPEFNTQSAVIEDSIDDVWPVLIDFMTTSGLTKSKVEKESGLVHAESKLGMNIWIAPVR